MRHAGWSRSLEKFAPCPEATSRVDLAAADGMQHDEHVFERLSNPLGVVVRNFAAGDLSRRLGISEGTALPRPIVEFYFKDDKLDNPLVSEEHIIAFGWASQQDLDDMVALALRVNDFLSGVMMGVGIRLADFCIEVGRIWEGDYQRLIVADEISPDSCRLWDMKSGQTVNLDPEVQIPMQAGPLCDVYTEVARRLGVLPSNVAHATKPTLSN